jgi:DNA-binding transcriptional LysR family regulator
VNSHGDVGFDFQTVHQDDMVRRLYERETDIVIGYEVPPGAPVSSRWLAEGELVAVFSLKDVPDPPARVSLESLAHLPFISMIKSGPMGRMLAHELNRLNVSLDEIMAVRTFYTAAALVGKGIGFTIVDNFTAEATVTDGVAYRPLQPGLSFDIHAVYLEARPPSKVATAFLAELASVMGHP